MGERPIELAGLGGVATCEGLHDDYEGFRLILRNRDATKVWALRFKTHWAYRVTQESHRLKSFDSKRRTPVFEVQDSRFVEWLREEAMSTVDGLELRHFVVITTEEIFDIVATDEPVLERLPPGKG